MCYEANSTAAKSCETVEVERTERCVKELGGDADKTVRYALGFSILGAAIIVDAVVRIVARKQSQVEEYKHL